MICVLHVLFVYDRMDLRDEKKTKSRTQINHIAPNTANGSQLLAAHVTIFPFIYLLEEVLGGDGLQDGLLRRLLDLPADKQLVEDEVRLLKVKDDVQLANLGNQNKRSVVRRVDDRKNLNEV